MIRIGGILQINLTTPRSQKKAHHFKMYVKNLNNRVK